MGFWEKIKRDVKKGIEGIDWERLKKEVESGIKKGVKAIRESSVVVKEKAGELSEKGKRQYRIFILKKKVQDLMAELGGKVYEMRATGKNPLTDTGIKQLLNRIAGLESQITELEKEEMTSTKKKTKRTTAKSKK